VFFGVLIYLAGMAWPVLGTVRQEVPLIAALVMGICWVWRANRIGLQDMQHIYLYCNRSLLSMTVVIGGVMVFQGILEEMHGSFFAFQYTEKLPLFPLFTKCLS
jgi:hypothetical protein